MSNYSNARELSEKMQKSLLVFAQMLGERDPGKAAEFGFEPGLGMMQHSAMLLQYRDKLSEGVFQLMFTGCFSCGKSTLLNALIRQPVLRMSINPETAVITKVMFGREEKVVLYMKKSDRQTGAVVKREMTLEEFFEEARVSQEDPDKFRDVDYAVITLAQEGIAGNTVQLIDSPGTQNSEADSEAARQFIKSANAVVYMINATTPFVEEDKKYIAQHYAGKHMKNLFFVINRIDGVNEDQLGELRHNVRAQLAGVFTDEQGRFDEKLFNSRVFYTNAYGSLQTRQGLPAARFMGQSIFIDDKDTGVPQFEEALAEYLTSDGRDKAAFEAYMPRMAGMYVAAEEETGRILQNYRRGISILESDRDKIRSNEARYRSVLQAIMGSCTSTVRGILDDARREYRSTVNRISAGWGKHFMDADVKFGLGQMVSLVGNKVHSFFNEEAAQESLKKIMTPFTDAVNAYISAEMKKMSGGLERSLKVRLTDLGQAIEQQTALLEGLDMPISIEDIAESLKELYHINVTAEGGMENNANLVQVLIGLILLDFDAVSEGVGNTSSMGSFIVKVVLKNIMEFVAWYVVAWPIGVAMLVARLVDAIRQGNAARNTGAQKMLEHMRETVIDSLEKGEDRFADSMEHKLAVITRAGKTMTSGIQDSIDDYVRSLEDTIEAIQANESAAGMEEERTGAILREMMDTFNELCRTLYGKQLDREEIRKLAVTE